ncbi:MAG: hypothetical protein ACR2LK_07165 [Solirubrobacteraceae bacterium]
MDRHLLRDYLRGPLGCGGERGGVLEELREDALIAGKNRILKGGQAEEVCGPSALAIALPG